MFYFRLNRVKIWDNGSGKFIGLFGKDKSKIQFISLVVSESVSTPDLGDIINETNAEKRKSLLKAATMSVANSVVFTPIHNVKDQFEVTFGNTGRILHLSEKIPKSFNWQFLCLKLNQDSRDLGTELQGIINSDKFDGFAASFPTLIGAAATAPYTAGIEIGKFIFKAFTNHLTTKKYKQLGILETSFIQQLDYKHGNAEALDVKDETGNLRIDYSLLGFDD
jgi:hypothetical protein